MLGKDARTARYLFAISFFFLSGSGMLTGYWGMTSGILGTVELSTGLLAYSPLVELIIHYKEQRS